MKVLIVLTVFLVSVALAGGGEGGHHSPLELFWKGFNILLFLGIVYWFGRKPVAEAFNNFWRSLYSEVENSEQELKKAEEDLKRAKEELEKAKVRAEQSVALARESAETEIKEAQRHAEEVAKRIKERARETVEVELKKAKEELALYGMKKAEEIALSMLEESFKKPEVRKSYVERQLRTLEGKND